MAWLDLEGRFDPSSMSVAGLAMPKVPPSKSALMDTLPLLQRAPLVTQSSEELWKANSE